MTAAPCGMHCLVEMGFYALLSGMQAGDELKSKTGTTVSFS